MEKYKGTILTIWCLCNRRVVASPMLLEIVDKDAIKELIQKRFVVIWSEPVCVRNVVSTLERRY